MPSTLYGLLLSRIDRLAADDRRALQEAAVLGAEFDSALLQRIASEPRSTEAALRPAGGGRPDPRRRGRAAQRWRFTHALLHEVAYQNLLLARRTELHQRAGRALEAVLGAMRRRRPTAKAAARGGWPSWRRWATTGACRRTRRAARAT